MFSNRSILTIGNVPPVDPGQKMPSWISKQKSKSDLHFEHFEKKEKDSFLDTAPLNTESKNGGRGIKKLNEHGAMNAPGFGGQQTFIKRSKPQLLAINKVLEEVIAKINNIINESESAKKEKKSLNQISNVKGVSSVSESKGIIDSLPEANWEAKYGGIPYTPSYGDFPPGACPMSIETSLVRVYLAGLNLMKKLKDLSYSGQEKEAKDYIFMMYPNYKKFIADVRSLHESKNPKNKIILDTFDYIIDYLFNIESVTDFIRSFDKFIFAINNNLNQFYI